MGKQIECPLCEAVFETEMSGSSEQLNCPFCNHSFDPTMALEVSKSSGPASLAIPLPPGAPEPVAESVTGSRPVQPTPPPPLADPVNLSARQDENSVSLHQVRRKLRDKKRKRNAISLAIGLLLTCTILTLLMLLVFRLGNIDLFGDSAGTPDVAQTLDEPVNEADPVTDVDDSAEATQQQVVNEPVVTRLADLPAQKFEFLTAGEVAEVWEIAQPRVVELTIYKPGQTIQAVGTIVDSRGWLLTSFHAVQGATRIEVRAAAKLIDEAASEELLRDEVRGIVASNPQLDQILLSINRRFVVTFGDLTLADQIRVVPGQYLIQTAPPATDNPYGAVEVRIADRITANNITGAAEAEIANRKLESGSLEWLVAETVAAAQPGTPLFNRDGELVGQIVFCSGAFSYCLPTDSMPELAKLASDRPQPLASIASQEQLQQIDNQLSDVHPMNATAQQMNEWGQQCEQFGWIATTASQFETWQTFSARVADVLRFTLENQNNPRESDQVEKLERQITRWQETISRATSQPDDQRQSSIKEMNRLAARQLIPRTLAGDAQFVPFFGKVLTAGVMSPDPDAMFLEIGDGGGYFRVPFEPTGEVMRPGTRWLFIVRRQSLREAKRYKESDLQFEAVTGDLQFAIGPLTD